MHRHFLSSKQWTHDENIPSYIQGPRSTFERGGGGRGLGFVMDHEVRGEGEGFRRHNTVGKNWVGAIASSRLSLTAAPDMSIVKVLCPVHYGMHQM